MVSFGTVGDYEDPEAEGSVDAVRGISQFLYLHCESLPQRSPSHRSVIEEAEHGGRLGLLPESEPFELELEDELDPGFFDAPEPPIASRLHISNICPNFIP